MWVLVRSWQKSRDEWFSEVDGTIFTVGGEIWGEDMQYAIEFWEASIVGSIKQLELKLWVNIKIEQNKIMKLLLQNLLANILES